MRTGWRLLIFVTVASAASFAAEPATKSPPPDYASLASANRSVRKIYDPDITKARTPPQQIELAQKLLQAAQEEKSNTTNRYALLLLARDTAVNAGDVEISTSVASAIIDSFSVDPLKLKLEIAQD